MCHRGEFGIWVLGPIFPLLCSMPFRYIRNIVLVSAHIFFVMFHAIWVYKEYSVSPCVRVRTLSSLAVSYCRKFDYCLHDDCKVILPYKLHHSEDCLEFYIDKICNFNTENGWGGGGDYAIQLGNHRPIADILVTLWWPITNEDPVPCLPLAPLNRLSLANGTGIIIVLCGGGVC